MADWLAREGGIIVSWWLLVTLAGAAVFPLCARLLNGLPDRGYTLSRAAGVLVVGFVYWLLATLGFLENSTGGMILSWVIVGIIAMIVYTQVGARNGEARIDWRGWWRANRSAVLAAEVIFAVMLIGWATMRAYQNNLLYTEKDMELAFISSVMRSETFPPNDPWMAGYAISYYYFGYVIAGMLSMLSGIASTVGFNMMSALVVALVSLTVFGVVYNLVRSRAHRIDTDPADPPKRGGASRRTAIITGIVGVMMVVAMGNWQVPVIELPYQTGTASESYLQFFDSNERQTTIDRPSETLADWANRGWWWFRASRVMNDRELNGNRQEVIDEFPAFSYILADNHPHVLSLPFAALGLGLALNVLLSRHAPRPAHVIFYAVCLGGLIFLNTWDGPIYMAAVIAAEALRRMYVRGSPRLTTGDIFSLIGLGVGIVGLSLLFYFPFLVSFRSQLGGILPNIQYPTLFQQFFVHFAPFLIILSFFLGVEAWRAGVRINWRAGLITALSIVGVLLLLMLVLVVFAAAIPSLRGPVSDWAAGNGGWGVVLPAILSKRITHSITGIVLTIGLILVVARLFPRVGSNVQEELDSVDQRVMNFPPATAFALMLVGVGLMLTIIPEFAYLRDNFSTRMNTVFKFYYQAWLVWGVASAYALYSILADRQERTPSLAVRGVFGVASVAAITAGMLFIVFGIYSRTQVEPGRNNGVDVEVTLDGGHSFVRAGLISEDDYASLQCLSEVVQGDDVVIVEAIGGSYDWGDGRYATITGLPILFNWGGHQGQWRGGTFGQIAGSREADVRALYTDPTWSNASATIERYGIDYIVFGSNERDQYGNAADVKFRDTLDVVCEVGSTRVYRVDAPVIAAVPAVP